MKNFKWIYLYFVKYQNLSEHEKAKKLENEKVNEIESDEENKNELTKN